VAADGEQVGVRSAELSIEENVMAVRVNSQGFILNPDGKVDKTVDQSHHAEFAAQILAAWKKTHKDAPPPDQTIMRVENGDCQWTIAEDAGADPVKTAYTMNEQFDDPDLINPGDYVFVDQSAVYAHSDTRDNTDIFADQTAHHTKTAGNDPTGVRGDVHTYVSTLPAPTLISDPQNGLHEQTLRNLLLLPSWDDNSAQGQAGRKIVTEEYLKLFPVTASSGQKDRATAFNELKVSLGVSKRTTDADGNPEFNDMNKDEMKTYLEGLGLKGDDLTKAVNNSEALLKNVNEGYNNVKTA
jgi:hypothetical protein